MNPGFSPKGVLTVDIVDFSLMRNQEQLEAIQSLIVMLQGAVPEPENKPERRLWSPGGDGGSLTFEDLFAALETAKTLAKIIDDYNRARPDKQPLEVRIGLHCGTVTVRNDLDSRLNVWGEGINISARVAGLAKPGQLLASRDFCERADLLNLGEPEVTYIGKWWIKHNKFLPIYNLYMDDAGIPPSEIDIWFEPFSYPIRQAIETYEAMMEQEWQDARKPFRVAVLAKRLLDLQPGHKRAKEVIESFARLRHARNSERPILYHEFLSPMTPDAIHYFFENAIFQDYEKGKTIAKEGEPANSLMMVVSGEIKPFIQGNPIPVRPAGDSASHIEKRRYPRKKGHGQTEKKELVFDEEAIIGEMGLFSEGHKRTATLIAEKNSTVLELKYNFLKLGNPEINGGNAATDPRQEIRNQIWELHRKRSVQNQVNTHPLLQKLPSTAQISLSDRGEFLPTRYDQSIYLETPDAYEYWTFIISGALTSFTAHSKQINYQPGDCLGPLRLTLKDNPFIKIEVAPNTQLVRFPWNWIKELLQDTSLEEFVKIANAIAERDRVYIS